MSGRHKGSTYCQECTLLHRHCLYLKILPTLCSEVENSMSLKNWTFGHLIKERGMFCPLWPLERVNVQPYDRSFSSESKSKVTLENFTFCFVSGWWEAPLISSWVLSFSAGKSLFCRYRARAMRICSPTTTLTRSTEWPSSSSISLEWFRRWIWVGSRLEILMFNSLTRWKNHR